MADLITAAIKAVAKDAKSTEYERGYHNGLVAGRYLTTDDATMEGLETVEGYITANSKEVGAADKALEVAAQEKAELEETVARLTVDNEEIRAELANYKDNTITLAQHEAMKKDLLEAIARAEDKTREAQEMASVALRNPVAGDKYTVAHDTKNRDKPWALVTQAGKVVSRYSTENEALAARVTTG